MKKVFTVNQKKSVPLVFWAGTLSLAVTLVGLILIRWMASGYDQAEAFRHMSVPVFLVVLFIGSPLFGLVLVWWLLSSSAGLAVTLEEDSISGKDPNSDRKAFPLAEITKISPYSSHSKEGFLVESRAQGSIYIDKHIENVSELHSLLAAHAEKNNA